MSAATAAAARTTTASTPGGGSWLDHLQPASWRGLPFSVNSTDYRRGRRFAVHEYPFRDVPWAEDIGRATRTISFSGFVVGDDCFIQAQALLIAAEAPGAGTLVHPSLGHITVALVSPLGAGERTETGRVVELLFEFVETGSGPLFPGTTVSTQDQVATKAAAAQSASASDFNKAAGQSAPAKATAPQAAGLAASPETTYTDSKGTVSLVPSDQGNMVFQSNNGTSAVSLFGDSASAQASDPGLTAGATGGIMAMSGMAYSRFDSPASPAAAATPAAALENQVAADAAVTKTTNDALMTIGFAI